MMDVTQLKTIVITAVITLIVNASGKWLWASVRNTAAANTITAKIRAMFSGPNRAVMTDILSIALYLFIVVQFGLRLRLGSRS